MEALRKSETPFVRNASNAVEADHYSPIFCALNLRDSSVRDYWMLRWRQANEHIGLGGIFLDSSYFPEWFFSFIMVERDERRAYYGEY